MKRSVGLLVLLLATASAAEEPKLITVPPALRTRSATFEASGIAWAPSLQRYLIVSDDSGPVGDDHQPWLLGMSRDGVFDDQVIAIEGIDELNDGESICAGPDGLFFLLSSHSPNKKGVVPPPRRQLLLLELKGRSLKVVGHADLSAYVDGGRSLLDVAGVTVSPATGHLDLEGVAYADQALFIGMKSPLTATGAAVILRIAAPVEALRAGRIPAGALRKETEVVLRTSKEVAQGIADLVRLPDGTWFLVANEPKGLPPDGGGALYTIPPHGKTARLLKQFDGLRPEGITVAEDGKSLLIVFDMNEKPPLWVRWPLKP